MSGGALALSSGLACFLLMCAPRLRPACSRRSRRLWGLRLSSFPFWDPLPTFWKFWMPQVPSSLVPSPRKKRKFLLTLQSFCTSCRTADAFRIKLQKMISQPTTQKNLSLPPSHTFPPSINSLPKSACFGLLIFFFFFFLYFVQSLSEPTPRTL